MARPPLPEIVYALLGVVVTVGYVLLAIVLPILAGLALVKYLWE